MSDQRDEVAGKVTTIQEDKEKSLKSSADGEEDYEAEIGMRGDVKVPKLTNDNYKKMIEINEN